MLFEISAIFYSYHNHYFSYIGKLLVNFRICGDHVLQGQHILENSNIFEIESSFKIVSKNRKTAI